jgi:hypothetical protein
MMYEPGYANLATLVFKAIKDAVREAGFAIE